MTQGDNNFPCDLLLRLILNCCWTPEQTVLNFSDRRMIVLALMLNVVARSERVVLASVCFHGSVGTQQ